MPCTLPTLSRLWVLCEAGFVPRSAGAGSPPPKGYRGTAPPHRGGIPWSKHFQRETKPVSFVWDGEETGSQVAQAGLQLLGLQVCCPAQPNVEDLELCLVPFSQCLNRPGMLVIINGFVLRFLLEFTAVLVLFCFHF